MLWLIPLLLVCLFLVLRFISPYEPSSFSNPFSSLSLSLSPTPPVLKETFVAPLHVSDEFKKHYRAFLHFYHPFLTSWKETLITAYQLEQPAPTTSSQTNPPEPTAIQLQTVVQKLTSSLGKPFPSLTDLFPEQIETLDDIDRERLMDRVPKSAQPYFHALEWMNDQLLKAQKEVENALKGGGLPSFDGFVSGSGGGTCADLSQCFKDNPELVRQLLQAQQEEAGQRLERFQRDLISRFEQFYQPRLVSALELNGRLRKSAKEMQQKAQSGDWIKDVKMGGSGGGDSEKIGLASPPGGDTLEELRRTNPEKYKQLQKGDASLFSVKQLFEQINRNLR